MSLIELDNPVSGPKLSPRGKIAARSNGKHPGGRDSKYELSMCTKAIELGTAGASLTEIAHELSITRETLYKWLEEHEEFSDAINRAKIAGQAFWEKAFRDNLTTKGFNGTPWIFTMKNRFRDDYRDDMPAPVTNNTVNVFGLEVLDQLIERRQTLLAQAPQVPSKP